MKDETQKDPDSGPKGLLKGGLSNKLNDSVKNPQYRIYNELLNYYYNKLSNANEDIYSRILLKRFMNNLVSSNGWDIALFFNEHIATTKPEIQAITHINWQSVNLIVNTFLETGLIKVLGQVGTPFRITGRPIPIYGFHHASPENTTEAQKRYGEIRHIKLGSEDKQGQIIEAIAIAKAFMDKREMKTIPDRSVIVPLLKESGITVNYNDVIQALHKEGYKW